MQKHKETKIVWLVPLVVLLFANIATLQSTGTLNASTLARTAKDIIHKPTLGDNMIRKHTKITSHVVAGFRSGELIFRVDTLH